MVLQSTGLVYTAAAPRKPRVIVSYLSYAHVHRLFTNEAGETAENGEEGRQMEGNEHTGTTTSPVLTRSSRPVRGNRCESVVPAFFLPDPEDARVDVRRDCEMKQKLFTLIS